MRSCTRASHRLAAVILAFFVALSVVPASAWTPQQTAPQQATPQPATGQTAPAESLPGPIQPSDIPESQKPWLYKGSDIPPDPAWTFGVLPNGVRYAVRRNGVPPGQVAIRVRMDAGSLMERDSERGYAHLIEHLAFRGSAYAGDSESKRIWQRLGVTFGSDSNASTTFTQTTYKLDLPSATEASLDESMHLLAGMIEKPDLDQAALDAERPVVLAERREQPGARVRVNEVKRDLFFAGQPLARRNPIGTLETLKAATPASVQAFHDRWYRPGRTMIVISGDLDPAVFERMIAKHFGGWQGKGADPETPDFGDPVAGKPVSATTLEPALPGIVTMAWLRPWTIGDDTIIFNQRRLVDRIALRIVARRLQHRARSGGSFLNAGADLDDVSRSANLTTVSILPVGGDWQPALRDVRGIIADARVNPPSQAEIDREVDEVVAAMKNAIASERIEPGVVQADGMVAAVDVHETLGSAEISYGILRGAIAKHFFTPARILAASKTIFAGTALRAAVNLREPDPRAEADLVAALKADVSGVASKREALADISFDDLPDFGPAGTVESRTTVLARPRIDKAIFDNGVNLLLFSNPSETNRVFVRVRFGHGYNALPADHVTPAWAGGIALSASGIGDLGLDELDRLTGDRQIGLDFAIDDDAFVFGGQTTPADLADQLRLIAAKLADPGWDSRPVERARAVALAAYDSQSASPDGVIAKELPGLLRDGDPRWATPSRDAIQALTPETFRAFWAPILASGPVEVDVYGDIDPDKTVAAVAKSLGALEQRSAPRVVPPSVRFPDHVATPVVRRHGGKPDQAGAVIAWPTGGGSGGIAESRKLDVLAAIFQDRLLDELRSEAGASYTPQVGSRWPVGLASGGDLLAVGLVPPDKTDLFFRLSRGIAADLAAEPVSADELDRALAPLKQRLSRAATGSIFWLQQSQGGAFDDRRLAAAGRLVGDYESATPAGIQALAKQYLVPDKDWTMVVLPPKEDKQQDDTQ